MKRVLKFLRDLFTKNILLKIVAVVFAAVVVILINL